MCAIESIYKNARMESAFFSYFSTETQTFLRLFAISNKLETKKKKKILRNGEMNARWMTSQFVCYRRLSWHWLCGRAHTDYERLTSMWWRCDLLTFRLLSNSHRKWLSLDVRDFVRRMPTMQTILFRNSFENYRLIKTHTKYIFICSTLFEPLFGCLRYKLLHYFGLLNGSDHTRKSNRNGKRKWNETLKNVQLN